MYKKVIILKTHGEGEEQLIENISGQTKKRRRNEDIEGMFDFLNDCKDVWTDAGGKA